GTFTVIHKRMSRVIPCLPVLIGAEERGSFPFRSGKARPSSLSESAARMLIGVRGATTQVGSGPHAIREERCALVMLSYCTYKIVSSSHQRYLHIDARTHPQSIHM